MVSWSGACDIIDEIWNKITWHILAFLGKGRTFCDNLACTYYHKYLHLHNYNFKTQKF